MLEKIKNNKNLILIIAGILLIGLGIGGRFIRFTNVIHQESQKQYRYLLKEVIKTNESISNLSNNTIPIIVEDSIISSYSFDFSKYFLHPILNPNLETPNIPDRIEIPAINLVAPIEISEFNFTDLQGETFGQWMAPSEYAASWQPDSALLGQVGNTVINGHHNEYGEVFGKLIDLQQGDIVYLYSHEKKFSYIIINKMILPERYQPIEVRKENAKWLGYSNDERITLVTCWPKESNTHRLILVAQPFYE